MPGKKREMAIARLACDLSERQRIVLQRKLEANRDKLRRLQERLDNPATPERKRAKLTSERDRLEEELLPNTLEKLLQGVNAALLRAANVKNKKES